MASVFTGPSLLSLSSAELTLTSFEVFDYPGSHQMHWSMLGKKRGESSLRSHVFIPFSVDSSDCLKEFMLCIPRLPAWCFKIWIYCYNNTSATVLKCKIVKRFLGDENNFIIKWHNCYYFKIYSMYPFLLCKIFCLCSWAHGYQFCTPCIYCNTACCTMLWAV